MHCQYSVILYFKCISDPVFQIYLKRSAKACYINNYFPEDLQASKFNIDIQSILIIIKQYVCLFL